jgi:hypothetical protein
VGFAGEVAGIVDHETGDVGPILSDYFDDKVDLTENSFSVFLGVTSQVAVQTYPIFVVVVGETSEFEET